MGKFFSGYLSTGWANLGLLILRVGTALLMFTHGWPKLTHYAALSRTFSDPLHVGSRISLLMVLFGELVCSLFLLIGLFTRLAVIVIILEMVVILALVFPHAGIGKQELVWLYLIIGCTILFCGPGRISVDGMIR